GVDKSAYGPVTFSGIAYLTGGTASDTFKFMGSTASVSGGLDGRTGAANTLDYTGYTGRVVVSLASNPATGVKGLSSSGIFNFQTFTGNTTSTNLFVGPQAGGSWNIAAPGTGTLNTTMSFAGFPNLTGSTGNDVFAFVTGVSLGGTLDG